MTLLGIEVTQTGLDLTRVILLTFFKMRVIIGQLAVGALHHIGHVIQEDVEQCWPHAAESWATPLDTGLQLDFGPLITSLWAQPFSPFAVHLTPHLHNKYFVSFSRSMQGQKAPKALLKGRGKHQPRLSPHPQTQSLQRRRTEVEQA